MKKNIDLNFFVLLEHINSRLIFGINKSGWILINNQHKSIVDYNSQNFIPLLILYEIPLAYMSEMIKNLKKSLDICDESLLQIMPFVEMTQTSFTINSNYWSEKAIDLLLENAIYSKNLSFFFNELDFDKWATQGLKHKVFKYNSLLSL